VFDFLNSNEETPQQGSVGGFLNPGMDPVTQAFMLNAGLHLLQGGWGTTGSQVAGALGSGLEAAGGAAAIQEQTRRADEKTGLAKQELNQRLQMHQEDIGSREKVAKMYTDQRMATGGGSSATLERQRRKYVADSVARFEASLPAMKLKGADREQARLEAMMNAIDEWDSQFPAGKTSPNPEAGAPPVGPPGAQSAPGKTSPNSAAPSAVTPRQAAPYTTPFAPRGQPTAAQPSPSTGGTAFSQVITDPKLTPEQRTKFMRLKDTAPGRQQLRSMGINPDG
jgi:hypothetical protein